MIRPLSACVLAIIAAMTTIAEAQTRFGGSGTSAFGQGFGSSGFGSSGFGNTGFGGGGFGSSGFGGGGFGSSGFGSGGFGSGGFGSSPFGAGGFGSSGFGGSALGNQGFGTSTYGGGQSFVGRDSGDMAAVFSQMGQAGTQFFNQMNRNTNRSNRTQQPAASSQNPPQIVRVDLRVAFNSPRPAPADLTNTIRTRLGKILADHNIAQPIVTMEGDIAVLGGVAATDSQRLVLEKLVALEPGVREVRNEMVVAPASAVETLPITDTTGN